MNTYKKDPVVLLLDPRGISKYNSFTVTNRLNEYAKQLTLESSYISLSLVVLSSSKNHKFKSKILFYNSKRNFSDTSKRITSIVICFKIKSNK
jgi:hypothetical protein